MFLISKKGLRASQRAVVFIATTALLAFGITPAQAADTHPVFLSFEAGDNGGLVAASNAGPFGGAATEIASSDHLTGKALKFTKGNEVWSGVNLLLRDTSAYKYADADHKVITMDYWSNDSAASPVMMKLTATDDSAAMKAVEAQPGLNQLSFDMSTGTGWDASKTYNLVTVFPNFGADDSTYSGAAAVANSSQVYEIDNVSFNGGTSADVLSAPPAKTAGAIFVGFETGEAVTTNNGTFGGPSAEVAASTHLTGKSLKFTKSGEAWGGVNLFVAGTTEYKYTATGKTVITMDYWSNDTVASPVMLKLESSAGNVVKALEAAPGLNHLSFDMSTATGWSADAEYTVMALFPNFGVDDATYTGAAAIANTGQVYEIDNISINGGLPPKVATSTVLTFEAADSLGALIVGAATGEKPQGGFEGAATSIAAAPAGGNGGNALKIVKATGGAVYAGVNMLINTNFRITDSGHKVVTFNYYSPKANSPVRIELVPWPVALGVQVTAAQGWQTLTVDLSTATGQNGAAWSADVEYTSLVLFPDFNQTADNATYYVDNFALNGGTTPAIPVTPTTVAPVLKTAAVVYGTAKLARTLTAGKGSWTGTPTPTYTYKWYRCTVSSTKTAITAPTSAMKCSVIVGKTASTYKLTTTDVGKYIRVLVTAKNSKGTKYSLTKTTAKVVK